MANIDNLTIQITADATKANNALDKLARNLTNVSSALSGVDSSRIRGLSSGIQGFAQAAQSLSSVKTADFTRLVTNLDNLSKVDSARLQTVAGSMHSMTNSINALSASSSGANNVTAIVTAVSKLGGAQVQKAVTNLPTLADGIEKVIVTLNNAPQVNRDVIDLINSMANLATQGQKVGSAFNGLTTSMNRFGATSRQTERHTSWFKDFLSTWGRLTLAVYTFRRIASAITNIGASAMDTYESLNYFNVAVDKVAKSSMNAFADAGYASADAYYDSFSNRLNDLIVQLTGYDVSGQNMFLTNMSTLGLNVSQVTQASAAYLQMADSIGMTGESALNTSKALTMLAADWSSLKNIKVEDSLAKMESALAGQSRAVRSLGIDITQTTLGELAMRLGIEKSITVMTQEEKSMLRVIAMLEQSKVAYGDLAYTINSPANQIRILQAQFENLTRSLGAIFLPTLEKILPYITGVTIAFNRMLVSIGNFIGVDWSQTIRDTGGLETAYDDLAEEIEDVTDAQDKLNKSTRKWDEINNISSSNKGSSANLGSTSPILDNALNNALADYESRWNEAFNSIENKGQAYADKITSILKDLFTPSVNVGKKINWKKVTNGFSSILGFATKFTGGVAKGYLEFVEATLRLSAPFVNGLGDAIDFLFDALTAIPEDVWVGLGGALGGFLTVLLGFKAVEGVKSIVNNLGGAFASLINPLTATPYGWIIAMIGAVVGGLMALKQHADNLIDNQVYNSVFDGLGISIHTVAEMINDAVNSTGTSVDTMIAYSDRLKSNNETLSNSLSAFDDYISKIENSGTVTEEESSDMVENINTLVSALKDNLHLNSSRVFEAFSNMSSKTAQALGVDVAEMTTILSNFEQRFNSIYDDMGGEANSIVAKVASGTATQEDLERLKTIYSDLSYLSADSIQAAIDTKSALSELADVDFGSVEETTKAIQTITDNATERMSKLDEYYKDQLNSVEVYKEQVARALELGKISEEEAKSYFGLFDTSALALKDSWESEKEAITEEIETAFAYIKAQVEKAGAEAYRNADEEYSIAAAIFHPHNQTDALKSFGENIYNPVVNALEDGLKKLNPNFQSFSREMWNEFETSVSESENVTGYMKDLALDAVEGYEKGILDNTDLATKAFENMINGCLKATAEAQDSHSPSKEYEKLGKYAMDGYILGVNEKQSFVVNALKYTASMAMQGFHDGLLSMENKIYDTVSRIATNVAKTMQDVLDIHSPSRVFKAFGIYSGEGYEEGLEESFKGVMSTLDDYTSNIVTSIEMPSVDYSAYRNMAQNSFDAINAADNMSETNGLLRILISAVQNGQSIQIDGREVARSVRNVANDYSNRNGKPYFAY